jgi:hypothetical protein
VSDHAYSCRCLLCGLLSVIVALPTLCARSGSYAWSEWQRSRAASFATAASRSRGRTASRGCHDIRPTTTEPLGWKALSEERPGGLFGRISKERAAWLGRSRAPFGTHLAARAAQCPLRFRRAGVRRARSCRAVQPLKVTFAATPTWTSIDRSAIIERLNRMLWVCCGSEHVCPTRIGSSLIFGDLSSIARRG